MNTLVDHTVRLKGLREDNPRDFLAALGLLRLIGLIWPENACSLAWDLSNRCPFVQTRNALPKNWTEQCVAALQELVGGDVNRIAHHDVIRTDANIFRESVRRAMNFALEDHPLARLPEFLYAAYSSQLPDDKDGRIEPSWFSFGNGQSGKNLLKDVCELIQSLSPERFQSAIRGSAEPIAGKSLRWSPAEFRAAAYRPHDPGAKTKGDDLLDIPAFNVMAFVGLSFFPTIASLDGNRTLGFVRDEFQRLLFRWPIWEPALCADELGSLLHSQPDDQLKARGIDCFWQSRRVSSDKSLYFLPAVPVATI